MKELKTSWDLQPGDGTGSSINDAMVRNENDKIIDAQNSVLNEILKLLPVGHIPSHTSDTVIERIKDLVVECSRLGIENDRLTSLMEGKFKVMLKTDEYTWEECSGPYDSYDEAEAARVCWFRNEDIPDMRIFMVLNKPKIRM